MEGWTNRNKSYTIVGTNEEVLNPCEICNASNNSVHVERNEDLARVEITVQAIIFVLAVVGNSLVLFTLFRMRKAMSRMHLLMFHLSIADLFVAFGSVLPQMIWDITFVFKGNDLLCKLVKYMQVVAIYASSYVLVMTAIDRYFAICYPLISHQWSSKKVHLMVIIAWSLSLLFSLPQMVIFSYQFNSLGLSDCWGTFDPEWTLTLYITVFTVLVYIIPTLILTFCYGRICLTVWKSGRIGEGVSSMSGQYTTPPTSKMAETEAICKQPAKAKQSTISKAKVKTIKLFMTVVLCYLICWSPFFIAQMRAVYDPTTPFDGPTYTIILLLASLNSCTNPWIYLAFSDKACGRIRHLLSSKTITGTRSTVHN